MSLLQARLVAVAVVLLVLPPLASAQTSTSTAITAVPTPAAFGQIVTVTATVTPATATGKVTFYAGTTPLGTSPLDGSGQATLVTSLLPSGTVNLHAVYIGDGLHNPSTSLPVAQTVTIRALDGTAPPVTYGGMNDPRAIAAGDFNGDGHTDVIVADNMLSVAWVYLGHADGTFDAPVASVTGSLPQSVAVADLNEDGRLDAVVGDVQANDASVLLGHGDGTFAAPAHVPSGGVAPRGIAVGDVNNDGHIDVIVTNAASSTISVLLGNGDGTFQPAVAYPTTSFPMGMAVADLNGDGYADLVAAVQSGGVDIFLNNETGVFPTRTNVASGGTTTSVATGDLNGDGRPDLICGLNDTAVSVMLNDGSGGLLFPAVYQTATFTRATAVGDANGDGQLDIIASGDGGTSLLPGHGDGTVGAAVLYAGISLGSEGALVIEANGDLAPDVVATNFLGNIQVILSAPPVAPTTTVALAPATPSGANGWYTGAPHVTVSATDNSGVAETRCTLDPATAPATFAELPAGCAFLGAGADVTADGAHVLYAASIDTSGTAEAPISTIVHVDQAPPVVACSLPAPQFTVGQADALVTATVTDLTSGAIAASVSAAADTATTGTRSVTLTGADLAGLTAGVSCQYVVVTPPCTTVGDRDCDGLSDEDEVRYGLDPDDATGDNGADGDPDHDGLTNRQELTSHPQSHPRGFYTQDFAEGATGFFKTTVGVLNASATASGHVLVTLLSDAPGTTASLPFVLDARQRKTIDVNAEIGATAVGVATRVESDQPIAATRDVRWGSPVYGSTLERGAPAASATWYFAEGATNVYSLYLLLANPNASPAHVTIDYLRSAGGPVTQTIDLPAFTRQTIDVASVPGLAVAEVGAAVTSDLPIVAERSMYASFAGRIFDAGSAGLGATALSRTWHFAEGATGFFDTFLLLVNPGATPASVSVVYTLPDGSTITKAHAVPAQSRLTIPVNDEDPALAVATFTTTVSSDQPLVAERSIWWGSPWYESDVSQGTPDTGTVWAIGEGAEGGADVDSTFVLVGNAAADAGQVRVTVIYDDGTSEQKDYALAGGARLTTRIADDFPQADGRRFSLLVESLGDSPVPLTVECARYQSTENVFGNAGGAALATKVP